MHTKDNRIKRRKLKKKDESRRENDKYGLRKKYQIQEQNTNKNGKRKRRICKNDIHDN